MYLKLLLSAIAMSFSCGLHGLLFVVHVLVERPANSSLIYFQTASRLCFSHFCVLRYRGGDRINEVRWISWFVRKAPGGSGVGACKH